MVFMVGVFLNPGSDGSDEKASHDLRRAVGLVEDGRSAPQRNHGLEAYGYLYDGELKLHSACAQYDFVSKKQALLVRKLRPLGRLDRLDFLRTRMPQPEAVKNPPGGVRAIERIEMDSTHLMLEKVVALFRGVVDAHPGDTFGIILTSLQGPKQPGREPGSRGQFGHALIGGDRAVHG